MSGDCTISDLATVSNGFEKACSVPLGVCIASIAAAPEPLLELIAPYRGNLAVAAECMFTWYWLADLCEREGIVFVLGHALYMRAIHGGKAKNDRIDAHKIAALLRGGMLPQAYGISARDARHARSHAAAQLPDA